VRKLNALLDYFRFILTHRRPHGDPMNNRPTLPKDLDAASAKKLLASERPGDLAVLDVRQGWEYEEFHLPGAKLAPLGELENHLNAIPRDKPLLVYCHSGRRSAAAASLLAAHGFPDVRNVLGGIMAWTGATATGSPETGMRYLSGDESPDQILALAFSMEQELGRFYHRLADDAQDPDLKALFSRLAGFEDKHKLVVYHLYKALHPQSAGIEELAAQATAKAMEGGRDPEDVLAERKQPGAVRDALDMAMGIEAQAMDLYMRFAAASDGESKQALLDLANEERGHLKALGNLMDRQGGQ